MLIESEIVLRLLASVLIGLMIGFARRHKPAGIRTFALLCLGCTIFTVISIADYSAPTDPTRVIAQIVSGIGFLGLGVIWKGGLNKMPTGVTTAASIWATAAIGVLVGLGMWLEVVVGSVLVLALLFSKKPLVKAHIEDE